MALTKVLGNVIADDTIGSDKIADDAIGSDKIADDAITSAQIADSAVTLAKIASSASEQFVPNLGTSVASTSGTSIDFTGIPSWVKRITVMLSSVSTNGSSQPLFQLGDSGGIETTGYITSTSSIVSSENPAVAYTNGWQIFSASATRVIQGSITFVLIDAATNTWSGSGIHTINQPSIGWHSGTKSLSATLDRVRITTVNGTDTFDAGSINILFE